MPITKELYNLCIAHGATEEQLKGIQTIAGYVAILTELDKKS